MKNQKLIKLPHVCIIDYTFKRNQILISINKSDLKILENIFCNCETNKKFPVSFRERALSRLKLFYLSESFIFSLAKQLQALHSLRTVTSLIKLSPEN